MKITWITGRNIRLVVFFGILFSSCSSSPMKQAKSYTVEIKQMKFVPQELELQKGDTVVFINRDLLTHDVTETPGKAWTSSPLSPNASWTMVAEKTSDYYCSIHPVMKGRLIVE